MRRIAIALLLGLWCVMAGVLATGCTSLKPQDDCANDSSCGATLPDGAAGDMAVPGDGGDGGAPDAAMPDAATVGMGASCGSFNRRDV